MCFLLFYLTLKISVYIKAVGIGNIDFMYSEAHFSSDINMKDVFMDAWICGQFISQKKYNTKQN